MRTLIFVLGILFCTLLAGCSSDSLPFSGGALEGQVVTPPSDWTAVGKPEVIQLETQGDEPYSVNLWVIGQGEDLFVFAGASRSNWVEHIEANPNVRLRSGEAIYELRATRITSAETMKAFGDAWDAKYGHRPRNENVDEAYLFRLTPRTSES